MLPPRRRPGEKKRIMDDELFMREAIRLSAQPARRGNEPSGAP
jgi:hypothetical protein